MQTVTPTACSTSSSPLGRGHNGVHHLDDPVQGWVRADGHVGAAEVVVDGAHHAHDVESRVPLGRVPVDQAWKYGFGFCQIVKPLLASF